MLNLTINSPAKINLFLRIVGRRQDGYHELASLFQTVSLFDVIHFSILEKKSTDELSCNDLGIPVDTSNLILKAADLFRRKTGLSFGLKVHLEKNIPYQSGLGGGSGNAATTLWALNQLCGQPATVEDLCAWAGEIGSDISFFFSQGTAYCTGRGEIVRSLPALQPINQKLWIVKPQGGLSTPAVYKQVNLNHLAQRDPEEFLKRFYTGDAEDFEYFNDLEGPAFVVMPALADLKAKLLGMDFQEVVLTGSGSGFFCLGKIADLDGMGIAGLGLECHEVQFINRSPDKWYG